MAVPATLRNLAFLLFSAPLCDHPLGKQQAANMRASQTPVHRSRWDIKARESRVGLTRLPGKPTLVCHPRRPILPILAS